MHVPNEFTTLLTLRPGVGTPPTASATNLVWKLLELKLHIGPLPPVTVQTIEREMFFHAEEHLSRAGSGAPLIELYNLLRALFFSLEWTLICRELHRR